MRLITVDEAKKNAAGYRERRYRMPREDERELVVQRWERVAATAERAAAGKRLRDAVHAVLTLDKANVWEVFEEALDAYDRSESE